MLSEKQAIDILQNQIADYVIGNYCAKCGDFSICENKDEDCYYIQAIDTVLNLVNKQNNILNKVEKYAKGIDDKELLLILKSNEIDELINKCKEGGII